MSNIVTLLKDLGTALNTNWTTATVYFCGLENHSEKLKYPIFEIVLMAKTDSSLANVRLTQYTVGIIATIDASEDRTTPEGMEERLEADNSIRQVIKAWQLSELPKGLGIGAISAIQTTEISALENGETGLQTSRRFRLGLQFDLQVMES